MSLATIIKQVDQLVKEREFFETITLARTNKDLYGIFDKLFKLYKEASTDINCFKEILKYMKAELIKRNIKLQSNTPAITVFVRYIFNSDRKRAYNYSRTLLAALKEKTESETMEQFIERKGGVEECRKNYVKTIETIENDLKLVKAIDAIKYELSTMSPVQTIEMPDASVVLNDECAYAFVLARVGINKELHVLRTVPKTTKFMEAIAFKELAKSLLADEAQAETKKKEEDLDLASDKAVATITINALGI